MGIKEAKAAAERLLKRHEDSFYTYATEGFVQTLANCLLDLPKERCEQALGTYPEELRKKIEEKLKKISETDWQSNPFRKRDETYVISQQDLITPEDYIALEDGLQDLNPEEYSEFYEEFEAKSKWLAEKANALRNKLAELGRLEYNQMQKLIQSLSLVDLYNIHTYSSESVKNAIFGNMSNSKKNMLLKDFTSISERLKKDCSYKETVQKIDKFMKNTPRL